MSLDISKSSFDENKKRNRNPIGAVKLQSENLTKIKASKLSVGELLKLCRPLTVHLTRCIPVDSSM